MLPACGNTKNEYKTDANKSSESPKNGSSKNEYPASVTDAFVRSCEASGSDKEFCLCLLESVKQKYDFEAFSVLEAKMKAGQTPPDFVEFIGKKRAECTTK